MHKHTRDLLDLALQHEALKFGEFTLKSGRISPYFFNIGAIDNGAGMARLAVCYAAALDASGIVFDSLFGPAYKGIPLVTALACQLARENQSVGFTYNRKEAKDHGEGGMLVGAEPGQRVVIVDDVITAGTAVRQAIELLRAQGSSIAALLIALDRQERGADERSPIQALAEDEGIPTIAVASLDDIIGFAENRELDADTLAAIKTYRQEFGI
ncbi:MAG TPA: orotate phosphoribosyltransferase [Salinisphaeraceae bacterium]|nr:orotate phosphoribosyltransferase [Salinisphaeraceae bacterium]